MLVKQYTRMQRNPRKMQLEKGHGEQVKFIKSLDEVQL
jgi:hypothetical protein